MDEEKTLHLFTFLQVYNLGPFWKYTHILSLGVK
jgi:hypothetical protein